MAEKEKKQKLDSEGNPIISEPPTGLKVIIREFTHDRTAMISFSIMVFIILAAVLGSFFINPERYTTINIMTQWAKPGTDGLILGGDDSGRDVFAELIVGMRNSIGIGWAVAALIEIIGIVVGLTSGYFGGIVDNILMRITDFFMILPALMIQIVVITIVPKFSIWVLILMITALGWMSTARLYRSQVLSQVNRDYILASKTSGTSNFKIMFFELLPNISSLLLVDITLTFATSVGVETGLTFLGYGLPDNTPSIGRLISFAQDPVTITSYPWSWLPATLLLLILSLSVNYTGRALRRAADARQRLG
ncbi:ABC transporter permease [Schleiferilactobacillus perolens]|uniref:Oligopeptide ABC transporter permease component OppC n=1 Tax=Schleiferilactobacillus perolens DSM 12744 TaxID=1423792 RepID=A0A0R1MXV0_9LACO|nr:ABC transporter permease [Schleiferilactobacillus perolens]KRL12960.1 oligopeptide ABC transporter permease component OppC [Schleiferilactobacillus perolens DSM 12744]